MVNQHVSSWARYSCAGHCHVPPEILEKIVVILISECRAFSSIASFSLASYQFRQIALRRYYAKLNVRSSRHWIASSSIPGIFDWVSDMKSSASFLKHKGYTSLARFNSLRSLELCFSSDGLSTQKLRTSLLFNNVTADLTRLTLTFLPRIDTALLSLVASRFPSLTRLEVSCTERLDDKCCWLCFEESSSCVVHSPIPDWFPSAESLVNAFAHALQPLNKLEHLHLGIFLSDADALYRHLERCASVMISSPRTGFYPSPPFGPAQCALCHAEHSTVVREREGFASAQMGKLLPSLIRIGWSTYFAGDAPGDCVQQKAAMQSSRIVEVRA